MWFRFTVLGLRLDSLLISIIESSRLSSSIITFEKCLGNYFISTTWFVWISSESKLRLGSVTSRNYENDLSGSGYVLNIWTSSSL